LFDRAHQVQGHKVPNWKVAEHVVALTGQRCSEEWIGLLRTEQPGRPVNPTMAKLVAIADFFQVTPAYFVDDEVTAIIQAAARGVRAADLFADLGPRLNWLFEHARSASAPEASNAQLAEHVAALTGQPCTDQDIRALRDDDSADRPTPSMAVVTAIADFFDVNPAYFVDSEQAAIIQASIGVVRAVRNAGPRRQLALREVATALRENAGDLSAENLFALAGLIRSFSTGPADSVPPTTVGPAHQIAPQRM
jgi:hypothetical protein